MNVSPIIKKWNKQQEKGDYEEEGVKGWGSELTLCLRMDIFMGHGHGQPLA
jgi:hypothetical protein